MILIVTPTPVDSLHGNGVTARRWAALLEDLGHAVEVDQEYRGGRYDALIALHARKSEKAIRSFHGHDPGVPVVIALTGTDLYPDPVTAGVDPAVLDLARCLIVLQSRGLAALGLPWARKARVIRQSMPPIPPLPTRQDCYEVAFLAHVRAVKDPLRLAYAARLLPGDSRVRVTHAGDARDGDLAATVAAESAANPRYDWLGLLPRPDALALLARSKILAVTSWDEGGANVITEALAAGVPVISSKIPGSIGLLGDDYPGYFPAGDTAALAEVLSAAERDRDGYYTTLRQRCEALRPITDPRAEKQALAELLRDIALG